MLRGRSSATLLAAVFALLVTTLATPARAVVRWVHGTLSYADREVWGTALSAKPVAYVTVTLKIDFDGSGPAPAYAMSPTMITSASGAWGGYFDLPLVGGPERLSIEFQSRDAYGVVTVYKATAWSGAPNHSATSSAIKTWTAGSMPIPPGTGSILMLKTVAESEDAVLLNILDNTYKAYAKANSWRASTELDAVGAVKVIHPDPNTSIRAASRYVPKCVDGVCGPGESEATLPATVKIGGGGGWQDGQIVHEYTHHLQYTLSRATPPGEGCMMCDGGACDDIGADYAWHEGFANFFAGAVLNSRYWGQWTSTCTESNAIAQTCASGGDAGFGLQTFIPYACFVPNMPLLADSQMAVGMSLWDIHDEDYGAEAHDWISGYWEYWGYPIQRHIFEVFDKEMDNESGAPPPQMTIGLFHDKLVGRNLFVGNHPYYDKIFKTHGQLPHPASDYSVSSFTTTSGSVPSGSSKTFYVTVASNSTFAYTDGAVVKLKYGATVLDTLTLYPPFPANATRSVTIPTSIGIGTKTITAMVDANDLFPESNESNNTATRSITVTTVCGDGICGGSETWVNCPTDCDPPEPPCFVAGTLVTMADGAQKPIERIVVGDTVLAFDEATGRPVASAVIDTYVHPDTEGLVVVNDTIETTANHPFYVAGRWVRADALVAGDPLVVATDADAGPAVSMACSATLVRNLEARPGRATTYNLEVATHHNYFAGGVLVHNIKP